MANLIFPAETTRTVMGVGGVGTPLTSVSGQTATIYLDSGGLTTATITTYPGGGAIIGSTLTIDTYGRLPFFFGPDTTTSVLYVKVGTGPVLPLLARCLGTDDPNTKTIYQSVVSGFSGAYMPLAGPATKTGDLTVKAGFLYLDRSTEGAGVAPETHLVGPSATWISGIDVANAPTGRDYVPIAQGGTYSFSDAVTTNASTTVTSAAQGGFVSAQAGKAISGPGIPGGTTIATVVSATQITLSAAATATASGVTLTITSTSVGDYFYVRHQGGISPTFGLGVTPPNRDAFLQVAAGPSDDIARAALKLLQGGSSTGDYLQLRDSGNTKRGWFDKDGTWNGEHIVEGASFVVQADVNNDRALVLRDNTNTYKFGYDFNSATGVIRFKNFVGGNVLWDAVGTAFEVIAPTFNLNSVATTTVAPAAGGAGALPATPKGYMTIQVAGINRQVAYY